MKAMFDRMVRRIGVPLGVLAILLAQKASPQTQITNEFWVSTSTNTAKLGTLSDPYDGSTRVKFDDVLSNLPPYSTLHILAGTYFTGGSKAGYPNVWWNLKTGQKILGSGMDVTVLKLVTTNNDTA